MAESDRSRSPVPARNRSDPRGQPQPLPLFPRWCGPMSSAVRHLQNMPRPQNRPSWAATHSGPYMMGRMWTPPVLPTSWASSQQFPPTPLNAPPPPTLPYPQPHEGPPTQPCSPTTPSISPSQPRSTNTPQSDQAPKTDNNEATRIYGFDLSPHWQEDRDH